MMNRLLVKPYLLFLLLFIPLFGKAQTYKRVYQAELLLKESRLDSALTIIDIPRSEIAQLSPGQRAHFHIIKGKILKLNSEVGKSLVNYKKAELYYMNQKNYDSILLVKTLKAEVFRYGSLKEECNAAIDEAEKYFQKSSSSDIRAYFLNRKLAIYNYYHFYTERPLIDSLIQEIYSLKDQIKDHEIIAYTLNEEGNVIENSKGYLASIPYYQKALDFSIKRDLKIACADIALNLARSYQMIEDYHKAIEVLRIGIEQAKKTDNLWQLSRLYERMSHNHQFIDDYKTAISYRDTLYYYAGRLNDRENWVELQKVEKRYNVGLKENELKLKDKEIEIAQNKIIYMLILLVVISIIAVILIVNHRKTLRTNRKLDKLYQENAFLLRETHHRIHNNLQLIIILINTELNKGSKEMENQLLKLQSQVDSIATLHRHLYQSEDKRKVQLDEYVKEIHHNLSEHFTSNNIQVNFDIPKISLQTDKAMQIGLIITELCINTLKHAFSEEIVNKKILLEIQSDKQSIYVSFSDNGDRLKGKEIHPKLVFQLLKQLKAEPETDTTNGYHLKFRLSKH